MQPYDENHIIGFGKDTVVIKAQAYYQGMKMAMFDVTDVAKSVRTGRKRSAVWLFHLPGRLCIPGRPGFGLQAQGRITHLTDEDYLKAGDSWYNSGRNIDRILYINDTLYTLSQEEIRANDLADLKKTGSLMMR